CARIQTNFDYW
nr:immunoglobulin heavy chain junction region [Macaca mulatta]MOY27981.1 immunoglobulin heavy chain junction region [Macaca mulatta]MOY28166.1 immunoglobulin heavy chain junction region [Macaca mulatta]MOY29168.1 immunoglobulin heavy chain junction region [Macaca mulatta]MOY30595.1 immunoglobulin heavy chain junction region [Macaca mulatta]